MAKRELDIAEFGLTYFLRTFDLDDSPFLALPIFPNRDGDNVDENSMAR